MTLRQSLGTDVERVYEHVEALLDGEDGLLILFDGDRMVSFTQGFDASPAQIELLYTDVERSVRNVVGGEATSQRSLGRSRDQRNEGGSRSRLAVFRPRIDSHGRTNRVADKRPQSVRVGRPPSDESDGVGFVPHLASHTL
jgi:hypothetical protein